MLATNEEESGHIPVLLAAPAKVLQFFEWSAVRGRELGLRPLDRSAQLGKAHDDHAIWKQVSRRGLSKAFRGKVLVQRFDQAEEARQVSQYRHRYGHACDVSVFRAMVATQVGVVDEAIAVARAALAVGARGLDP